MVAFPRKLLRPLPLRRQKIPPQIHRQPRRRPRPPQRTRLHQAPDHQPRIQAPRRPRRPPGEDLKPKLEFFAGIGYTGADLGKLISSDPNLLLSSLEKRIVLNFDFFKTLLGSPAAVIAAIAGSSRLLRYNLSTVMLPNLRTLRDHGVPAPKIVMLLARRWRRGRESWRFMATWERKLAVYRSLGWSEKDTLMAFTKHPYCMLSSDKKIRKVMEFFVKKMNWEPAFVAARPKLLCLSLEKRTIPRCSVFSILESKGVVSRKWGVPTFLLISEKEFLEKYVIKYGKQIPEVLEAYQGKLEFVGLKARYRRS
ncbi:putative transcription termination factor MTERF8, chloroplastic [Cocos nucifera]|nr:putative transcription termination factor MTERF8, chloroplastic [Cocos nucifera]